MIIKPNNHIEANSLFPNVDWYDEGNYVIDETREENQKLIQKIKEYAPYIELVIENKEVIDVIPIERPEPETVILEPTTEEMLLQAYLKIDELENRLQVLEGSK